MYATNLVNLLKLMIDKEGKLSINREDEIIRGCLVTHEGKIVNPALVPAAVSPGVPS
jgi:NAD(P) transhydrogenase subunit alpha